MADTPQYLILGEVLRPHGVRGELRIRILTDYPERIVAGKTIYLAEDIDSKATPYQVEHLRTNKEFGLLKLRGIDNRDQAELMRELLVLTDIDDAVPLDEGEFYLYELIGLDVQTEDGESLGTLIEVLETGANDVYIVDSPRYGEVLIPAIDEAILKTDIDAGVMTVRLPEGLLPSQ
jgi:16S rRNA processing protein RimM